MWDGGFYIASMRCVSEGRWRVDEERRLGTAFVSMRGVGGRRLLRRASVWDGGFGVASAGDGFWRRASVGDGFLTCASVWNGGFGVALAGDGFGGARRCGMAVLTLRRLGMALGGVRRPGMALGGTRWCEV